MMTHVKRWGNSLAVRIPKALANRLGIAEGMRVTVSAERDRLVIRPLAPVYGLEDLLKRITRKNLHKETGAGGPVGAEIW